MSSSNQFKSILVFALSLFLFACGSNDKTETSSSEAKKSNKIVKSKCDKIIEDYDKLVTKSIEFAKASMNGEEVDKAEQDKLTKEGEALAKKIQSMGLVGLGGQHCYEEFAAIQLKWSQAFIEIQQKAMEEAMKQLENK